MPDSLEEAKRVLTANESVPYGIFGVVSSSDVFPPYEFLNEFFAQGSDPCDQDFRMGKWVPFRLTLEEYSAIKLWWSEQHPNATEERLHVTNWYDWVQALLARFA